MDYIIFYYNKKNHNYLNCLPDEPIELNILNNFYHLLDVYEIDKQFFNSLLETLNKCYDLLGRYIVIRYDLMDYNIQNLKNICESNTSEFNTIPIIYIITNITDLIKYFKNINRWILRESNPTRDNLVKKMDKDKHQTLMNELQEALSFLKKIIITTKSKKNLLQEQLNTINITKEEFLNKDDIIIQNINKNNYYGFYKNNLIINSIFNNFKYKRNINTNYLDLQINCVVFNIDKIYTIKPDYLKYIKINNKLDLTISYNKYTEDIQHEIKNYLPNSILTNSYIKISVVMQDTSNLYHEIIQVKNNCI